VQREKQLIKNVFIYALGNLGSKFISFFLLPLYTFYLTQSEFGSFDLIFTTINLIIPLVTFQISDGLYRYMLTVKTEGEIKGVFTNSIAIVLLNVSIASLIFFGITALIALEYRFIIFMMFLLTMFTTLLGQAVRAMRKNAVYSLSGVIFSAATILASVVFIVILKRKIDGLIIASVISNGVTITFLLIFSGVHKYLDFKAIDKNIIRKLVAFCLPLIPSMLCWWLMKFIDRYMLNYFMGMDANGVYAVANRFPTILVGLNLIINLAWRESAIIEYEAQDRNEFYSRVFNYLAVCMLSVILILIPATKLAIKFIVHENFSEAVNFIPFLYIATVFSLFSSFYETGYFSSEKTLGVFLTSVYGALAKILFGLLLIPLLGIQGASISSLIAFVVLWICRLIGTRKFFQIKLDLFRFGSLLILCLLFSIIYFFSNIWSELVLLGLALVGFYFFNRTFIAKLMKLVKIKFVLKLAKRGQ
jgi:O-antigen/teichoic acid export membrane protein